MAVATQRQARSAGISYQELISRDVVPPPRTLTLENKFESPPTTVPVSRYTTQAFHDLEMREHVAEGVADGVPRRRDSERRRLHDVRDRQLFDHRRAHAAGHFARTTTSVAIAAADCAMPTDTQRVSSARSTASAGTSTDRCAR